MDAHDLFCSETCEPIGLTQDKKISLSEHLETLSMLLEKEDRQKLNIHPNYIQTIQINGMESEWRQKLCHWMFDLGNHYDFPQDVIASAVHYMDQYLSMESLDKTSIQLLSITCLFIASKMHISSPICMEEIYLLTSNMFSDKSVFQMEANITKKLRWKLNPLTSFAFARLFLNILDYNESSTIWNRVMQTLEKIHELYAFVGYKNSYIALVAIQMACYEITPIEENIQVIIDTIQFKSRSNMIYILQVLSDIKMILKGECIHYTNTHKISSFDRNVSKLDLLIMLLSN